MATFWILCVLISLIGVVTSQQVTDAPATTPKRHRCGGSSDSSSNTSDPQTPVSNDGSTISEMECNPGTILAPASIFGNPLSPTTDISHSPTPTTVDGNQDGATTNSKGATATAETTTTNDWKDKYESFKSECGGQECSDNCTTALVALVYNIPDITADDGVNYYQLFLNILQGCSSSVGSIANEGSSPTHLQPSSGSLSTADSESSSLASGSGGAGSDTANGGAIGTGSNSGSSISPRAVAMPVVTGIVALLISVGH